MYPIRDVNLFYFVGRYKRSSILASFELIPHLIVSIIIQLKSTHIRCGTNHFNGSNWIESHEVYIVSFGRI